MRATPCAAILCAIVAAAPPALANPNDPWLGRDKALHFGISAVIAGGSYGAACVVVEPPWQRATIGASVAVAAGATKEWIDFAGYGQPSWRDFTWDLAGAAAGVGLALLIDRVWLHRSDPVTARQVDRTRQTAAPFAIRF